MLDRILQSSFKGLTGDFSFVDGYLVPVNIFRLINVVGKSYRELGFWSEGLGFSKGITKGSNYNKSMIIMGNVFWPGGPRSAPMGWKVPTNPIPLKIGVPVQVCRVLTTLLRAGTKDISVRQSKAATKSLAIQEAFQYPFVGFNRSG